MKICPICGKENEEDQTLCRCGFSFEGTNHIPSSHEGVPRSIKREKKRLFLSKRRKVIIVALVIVLVLGLSGFAAFYNSFVHYGKNFDPVIYISEGRILCADASKPYARAMEIDTADEETSLCFSVTDNLLIKEDNSLLVYPNNYRHSEDGFSTVYDLYLFNFEAPDEPAKKIAEDVSSYTVNSAFDTVTCLKGEGAGSLLYRIGIDGEVELIAKNISSYSISADGGCIIYETSKGNVYLYKAGEEPKLILKNATVEYVADDFSQFFCLQKGKLTKHTPEGEKALIAKDVSVSPYMTTGFKEGKGYYTKLSASFPLSDYLIDDMASRDKKSGISEEKLIRDEIRKEVYKSDCAYVGLYTLFYYDGVKSRKVAENVSDVYFEEDSDGALCTYSVSEKQSFKKVTMSKLVSALEGSYKKSFHAYLTSDSAMNEKHYMCFENKSLHIEKAKNIYDINNVRYVFDKNEIYFTVNDEINEEADLYRLSADFSASSQPEAVAQDVSDFSVYILPDGKFVYLKENEDEENEDSYSLYLNNELISETVAGYHEFNYPVENILFLQSYKEDDTDFSYIHINKNGVNRFNCSVNIDYGAASLFTERDNIILSDGDLSAGNTLFVKRNKAKKAYLTVNSQTLHETSAFVLPSHPAAVKNQTNRDWSVLD